MIADFEEPGVDPRLRQLLGKASPIKWGLFHHLRTSIYFQNRVAILGDSAHASLPFQAAGAAQGVEDALVLSAVFSAILTNGANRLPNIRAALAAYDSVRRPRAQKQLEQSAEVARMMFFQHEEAGADMNEILPRLQQGRFDWLWFHEIEKDVDIAKARMQDMEKI